jgi:hypothetical protein
MKTITAALRNAVRYGHTRTPTVTAYLRDGTRPVVVPVTEGSVSFALGGSAGLRSGSFTVPGYEWAPSSDTAPLAPLGQYVTISFTYPGLGVVDLGGFPILGVETTRPGGAVRVTLGDWAYRPARYVLEGPASWPATTKVSDLIVALVSEAYSSPVALVRDDTAGKTLAGQGFTAKQGDSRWKIAADVADLIECDVWFVDRGRLAIGNRYSVPAPVEVLATGPGGSVVVVTSSIDVLTAYNRVIATVESSGSDAASFRAVRTLTTGPFAYDTLGIGKMPLVETERVDNASQAVADDLADRLFTRQAGVVRKLHIDAIPFPWIEPGDAVVVTGPTGSETAVVESVSLPLTTGATMTVDTRASSVQTAGPFPATPRVLGVDT